MKRVLIVVLLLMMFIFVGCDDGSGPVIPVDTEAVQNVIDSIDFLIYDKDDLNMSLEKDRNRIIVIRDEYDVLKDDEKELITNYEDFLEIEELLVQYNKDQEQKAEEKAKKIAALAEAKASILESLPSSSGKQVELVDFYESENGLYVRVNWTTSDPQTINTKGEVIRPRGEPIRVTLSANLSCGGETDKLEKVILVTAISYTKLPKTPVFAYYYSNQIAPSTDELNAIDVFILSFGGITSDGEVYVTGMNLTPTLQTRKADSRVLYSVQNKEGFKNHTTPANRAKFVKSFVDVVEKFHFDGIDIDWEYPENSTEINNYVEFIKALYAALKAANPNYMLTSAMYGGNGVSKYKAEVVHPYLDYINLMTYDLNSAELTTHLTPLRASNNYSSVEQTVAFYANSGVPKEKLVIGAAFYGKVYELSLTGTAIFRTAPLNAPVSILYKAIKTAYLENIDGVNITRYWDDTAKAPYLYVIERNSNNEITSRKYITYDDVESIKLKTQYMFDEGLGGIMFWELGYADRQDNDLVKAIYQVIKLN